MARTGSGGFLVILFFLSCAGCQNLFGPKGPPHDPIFVVKKPAEAKPQAGPPTTLAFSEPMLPREPWLEKNQPHIAVTPGRRVPAILTNRVLDLEGRQREPND